MPSRAQRLYTEQCGRGFVSVPDAADVAVQRNPLILVEADDVMGQLGDCVWTDAAGGELHLHVGERLGDLGGESSIHEYPIDRPTPLSGEEDGPARRRDHDVGVDGGWIEHTVGIDVLEGGHGRSSFQLTNPRYRYPRDESRDSGSFGLRGRCLG